MYDPARQWRCPFIDFHHGLLAPEVKNLRVGLVDESLAHFATLARSVLVRGSGLDVVHAQLLALGFFATLLVGFSAWKFRAQMS